MPLGWAVAQLSAIAALGRFPHVVFWSLVIDGAQDPVDLTSRVALSRTDRGQHVSATRRLFRLSDFLSAEGGLSLMYLV